LLTQRSYWLRDMTILIKQNFEDKGLTKVGTGELPSRLIKILGIFDSQIRLIAPLLGVEIYADNQKSKDLLGLTYERNLDDTVVETV
jgi:hypothetical protein